MITQGLEKDLFKALSINVLIIISTSLITYKTFLLSGGLWGIIVNLLQTLQLPNVVVTVPAAGALLQTDSTYFILCRAEDSESFVVTLGANTHTLPLPQLPSICSSQINQLVNSWVSLAWYTEMSCASPEYGLSFEPAVIYTRGTTDDAEWAVTQPQHDSLHR